MPKTVTVHVSDATNTVELGDGNTNIVRRTNDQAVTNIKSRPPQTAKIP